MTLYHRTSRERAQSILEHGFQDGTRTYLTEQTFSGVWLSNVPLDAGAGGVAVSKDTVLLQVCTNLSESDLLAYEWVEEGKPYREFLIPASVINSRSQVSIAKDEAAQNDD